MEVSRAPWHEVSLAIRLLSIDEEARIFRDQRRQDELNRAQSRRR